MVVGPASPADEVRTFWLIVGVMTPLLKQSILTVMSWPATADWRSGVE